MNSDVGDSLDGLYFGPTPVRTIIDWAMPFLTDEAGDGDLIWRCGALACISLCSS